MDNQLTNDVFYYSNYCPHSKRVLQMISRHGLIERISCLCVDKRRQDPQTMTWQIMTERGQWKPLPPILRNVPSILCVRAKCTVVDGSEACLGYLANTYQLPIEQDAGRAVQVHANGVGGVVMGPGATIEPMSANAFGGTTNSYVSVNSAPQTISTPPETYQPNKLGSEVTIEALQQQRIL
jgi:hypothetical protein